jgi:hypothetical protein
MAKKKRTTKKRSTKASKRRPAAKLKRKAKPVDTPPVVTNFDPTPSLIAADQRKLNAAVRSTAGESNTPLPLRAEQTMACTSGFAQDAFVLPAPVPVKPTV